MLELFQQEIYSQNYIFGPRKGDLFKKPGNYSI